MSQIDLESFHRLEEFPSFTSCIRSFGRPIIPPLVTVNNVHDLRQLRAAAISKEVEILRKKKDHLREGKDDHPLSTFLENVSKCEFQSSMQDSCALWYPSYLDNQEVSVAISKFPTSGIYSSVHTDAIVCSNVVGSNHAYDSEGVKDVYLDVGANVADCVECSHSNINLECSLCLAELDQSLCNKSFPEDLSPEVPCRTFSLLQHSDLGVIDRELNNTVEDAGCESLPTIICNQKNIQADTDDSESNATCMTQSTDLDKYMELSCEFSSSDNSAVMWDSKISSQQCTLSRSDDASSETIVNTENELTPCASTMAELTDNIEDEFSNAEEVAGAFNNSKMTTGEMKRSHSVDSYMKIYQNCTKSLNVKKSRSEPFNTNDASSSSDMNDVKTTVTSKANLLIKEDSKESEEAQDVPEKDDCAQEVLMKEDKTPTPDVLKTDSFQKKHVRQNSYTLDRPSSALILAHADCDCNFDAECVSPHCSAIKDTKEVVSNSAFTKEKVDITAPSLQMTMLPILNAETTSKAAYLNKEEISSTVVDVFPYLKESTSEKSDSANTEKSANACAISIPEDPKFDTEEYLSKNLLENLNLSNQPKHLEYIQHICEELKVSHELRVQKLREEQSRQWLKLEEEFKEQEKLLYEKVMAFESSRVLLSKNEDDLIKSNLNYCDHSKTSDDKCVVQIELPVTNSSASLSDQIPTSDSSSSTQTSSLLIPDKSSSSLSPTKMSVLPENVRALSPSKECVSSVKNPSKTFEATKTKQVCKDSNISMISKDPSESVLEVNGFNPPTSFVPHYSSLPEYRSAIAVPIYNNCDKMSTCFCDNTFQPCRCCAASLNGYSEYDINTSPPYSIPPSQELNFSSSKDRSSQSDSVAYKKQSSCSGVHHSKSKDSSDFNSFKVNVANLSRKSNDSISSVQSSVSRSLENSEPSNAHYHDKEESKSFSLSAKQRTALDNSVSVYAKPMKNGTCILHDAVLNKKMNIDHFLMRKFEKLPAFVKGYLTRRLLNTEYVQKLIKNFKDTALLIGKIREDLPRKADSVSQGDIDFQRQLIVLLMTTYDNFYDTFFTISIKEQMNIITESRNFRRKPKNTDQEQEPTPLVTSNTPESLVSKQHKLSSATLKVLERKKRPIDSRTYSVQDLRKARSRSALDMSTHTIDDLPSFSGRAQSSMSSKGVPFSPTSVSLKRKTASAKSSGSKGCVHQKWVP